MKARLLAVAGFSLALASSYAYADTVVIPDTVTHYVTEQPVEEGTVVEGNVDVGTELPESVVIKTIPDDDSYGYAFVNKERVIVEPKTRKIIRVVQ
jgi:hypothetical protein